MAAKSVQKAAEAVSAADIAATDALGEYKDRLPVRALSRVAKLGDQPELRAISGVTMAAGLIFRSARLFRAGVRMLIAHELATAAKDVIKTRIDRTRPHSANGAKQAKPSPGRKTAKKHTSFPSGHSAGSVAVAQAFAREFPQYRAPALAAAAVIAFGQIPKNAHYPTDVLAGLVLGAASGALVGAMWPTPAKLPSVQEPKRTESQSANA